MPWVDVSFEDIEIGDVLICGDGRNTRNRFKVSRINCSAPDAENWKVFDDSNNDSWCHSKSPNWSYQKWVGEFAPPSTFESELDVELAAFKAFLMAKNKKYGNSALEPVRVFSGADEREQLRVRMDDKLNRIMNKNKDEDEDVMKDLVGYWFLERILERRGQ